MKKSSVAYRLCPGILVLAVLLLGRVAFGQENAPPLLVIISVDGMKPEYVTAADAHGLKVPNLRKFLKEGAYADGVIGVIPTVTYPSHTTMVTGVLPATHGIWANTVFDPLKTNHDAWYWYAKDIRVPTLWDAAESGGPNDSQSAVAGDRWRKNYLEHSGGVAPGNAGRREVAARSVNERIDGRSSRGNWQLSRRDRHQPRSR